MNCTTMRNIYVPALFVLAHSLRMLHTRYAPRVSSYSIVELCSRLQVMVRLLQVTNASLYLNQPKSKEKDEKETEIAVLPRQRKTEL